MTRCPTCNDYVNDPITHECPNHKFDGPGEYPTFHDTIRDQLKDLYNAASFDYDTMPEEGKRAFMKLCIKTLDKVIKEL
jgi:hypothetical protein